MERLREILVTDRTQKDVNARNGKGTYNDVDLNRVLRAVSWLAGRMERYGYSVPGEYFPAVLIHAAADPPGGGTVQGALCYVCETAEVVATPAKDFTFIRWSENGETVSTNPEYQFTANVDRELVAVFGTQEGAQRGIVGVGRVGSALIEKGA